MENDDYNRINFKVDNILKIIWYVGLFLGVMILNWIFYNELGFVFAGIITTFAFSMYNVVSLEKIIILPNKEEVLFERRVFLKRSYLKIKLTNSCVCYTRSMGAGVKRHSFKVLTNEDIKLLDIIPGITGWSDSRLEKIADCINNIKLKK